MQESHLAVKQLEMFCARGVVVAVLAELECDLDTIWRCNDHVTVVTHTVKSVATLAKLGHRAQRLCCSRNDPEETDSWMFSNLGHLQRSAALVDARHSAAAVMIDDGVLLEVSVGLLNVDTTTRVVAHHLLSIRAA
jgi:hypothetical protein